MHRRCIPLIGGSIARGGRFTSATLARRNPRSKVTPMGAPFRCRVRPRRPHRVGGFGHQHAPGVHASRGGTCGHRGGGACVDAQVSDDMQALDARAKEKGVLVLNEMGLDPGIDHMSAMQVIDEIREAGGTMVSFASYCGGLVAPASDDNPWHYKLSWNPRNVVLAGQGARPRSWIAVGCAWCRRTKPSRR